MKEDTMKTQNETTEPLFTGDYRRDTAVSEYEKAAEASSFLLEIIKSLFKKKQGDKYLNKK